LVNKEKNIKKFIIVTGLSGAGKTVAMRCFEDIGFFCVENLPIVLIPNFARLCSQKYYEDTSRMALKIDTREKNFLKNTLVSLNSILKAGFNYEILYLESSNEALLHRYKESRRPHPLHYGTIFQDIKKERKKLEPIRKKADIIIDTTNLTSQELKELLMKDYLQVPAKEMIVSVVSFGYKYGIPPDADLVFDVRFLPNPHYIRSLSAHSGKEKNVRDYVLKWDVTKKFEAKLFSVLEFLIPQYAHEGKSYLTIAVGCTGGKHRSVVISELLKKFFAKMNYNVKLKHRDISKK